MADIHFYRTEGRSPIDGDAGAHARRKVILNTCDPFDTRLVDPGDQTHRTEICEGRQVDTVILRENLRQTNLVGADGVKLRAERNLGHRVAGTHAGDLEAAKRGAALEETFVDRDVLAAIAGDITDIGRHRGDQVEKEWVVEFHTQCGAKIFEVAAKARHVLADGHIPAAG